MKLENETKEDGLDDINNKGRWDRSIPRPRYLLHWMDYSRDFPSSVNWRDKWPLSLPLSHVFHGFSTFENFIFDKGSRDHIVQVVFGSIRIWQLGLKAAAELITWRIRTTQIGKNTVGFELWMMDGTLFNLGKLIQLRLPKWPTQIIVLHLVKYMYH